MTTYSKKLQEQINQYRDVNTKRNVADIQELPDIFHYWSNKYVLPLIVDVLGVGNVIELYSKYFRESLGKITDNHVLLSVGCGDCSFESEIARDLISKGVNGFIFECIDISPHLVQRSREKVDAHGLGSYFKIYQADINQWEPDKRYCGVMAHQSLHHVLQLEHLIGGIKKALHPEGFFISSDMIGRNGHMRWPEVLDIVNVIWAFMPDHLKYNRLLKRFENTYQNHDCAHEGFEGIRSQDILPLLVREFHFERFLAYGNIPDIFIERSFGHNFTPDDAKEKAFVDFLELLNRLLIDLGHIKPTMMFAVMNKKGGKTTSFRHWTPEYCIRHTSKQERRSQRKKRLLIGIVDKIWPWTFRLQS